MSIYPATTTGLHCYPETPGVIRNSREEVVIEVRNYVKDRSEFAEFIIDATGFCRTNNIDPSAADPLKGYREQVCQEQREACAARASQCFDAYRNTGKLFPSIVSVVLATPAPKPKVKP